MKAKFRAVPSTPTIVGIPATNTSTYVLGVVKTLVLTVSNQIVDEVQW